MRQPTHPWEEIDFEALQRTEPTVRTKMYVRMDSEGEITVQLVIELLP